MFLVRPVETSDVAALEALAATADPVVHTLPRTRKAIERAVERSIASFAARVDLPADESYFFVLESEVDQSLAGAAAIFASAGASGAFYAFRKDVLQQVSRDLCISHNVHALSLCSDLSSHSQLASFCLRKGKEQQAQLLSRARLLFAALAPHRFSEKFFAAMSGTTDGGMHSPFWDAIGRKFFRMDFLEAERMIEGARNRSLIVELMPHYPVYVPLLPAEAQAAMGKVHPGGALPFRILSQEGFVPDEYMDIFDGGPILRAHRNALRSFSASMQRRVARESGAEHGSRASYLITVAREEKFRAVLADCIDLELSESVHLTDQVRRSLDVAEGEPVLCVKL